MTAYKILGKNVPSHYLAIATLTATGALVGYLGSGSSSKKEPVESGAAPSNIDSAASKDDIDVEKLISDFVNDQEKNAK